VVALEFEELRVLQAAEAVADGVWEQVMGWKPFARDTVGKQLARAIDSIGANIAEAYGRFHYGERLQFLYYARGSLFEAKYWLNRASARQLIPSDDVRQHITGLTDLACQLNSFVGSIKAHQKGGTKAVREESVVYGTDQSTVGSEAFLTDEELQWLGSNP